MKEIDTSFEELIQAMEDRKNALIHLANALDAINKFEKEDYNTYSDIQKSDNQRETT